MRTTILILLTALTLGCGNDARSKGGGGPVNPNNVNGTTGTGECGDGVVSGAELCDSAIESGPGACPESCSAPACSTVTLEGTPQACSARCVVEPVGCLDGDGCCAPGCDSTSDSDCTNLCGDGVVEAPEICDADCPTMCDDGNRCTVESLRGEAATCTAECVFQPLQTCSDGDGCCPPSCNANNDSDCGANCGNGILEPGESCDGDCPTTCDDGNACTTDALAGSAASCNVVCQQTPIAACVDSDGCCPLGCTSANDTDCSASCGNGTLDPGETCDGNCPTSCNDQDQCTADRLVGTAAQCNVQCSQTRITSCRDGDGCCPNGCQFGNDSDCACVPETCSGLGRECGSASDGCGGSLNCGTCSEGSCSAGICGGSGGTGSIGDPCTTIDDCGPDAISCDTAITGGICTSLCFPGASTCPAGSSCAILSTQLFFCVPVCNTDSDCRPGWSCLPDILSTTSICTP